MNSNLLNKPLLIFFAALFCGGVAVGIFYGKSSDNANKQKTAMSGPTAVPGPENSIYIKPFSDAFGTKNEIVRLYVYIDSPKHKVSGYDIVLPFDSEALSFQSATSILSDFQVFSHAKNGVLSITGTKKLSENTYETMHNAQVAELIFTPRKSGEFLFEPKFEKEKTNDTNIIDEEGTDVLEKVSGISFIVGDKKTLPKGKAIELSSGVIITFVSANIPQAQCMDCITTAIFSISQKNQKKNLEFRDGGIAGQSILSGKVFGHTFQLVAVDENMATLLVVEDK